MNDIITYNNDELKQSIRTVKNDDGSISVNLEDAAKGLGFTKVEQKNGNAYTSVRWERVNKYLNDFGVFSNDDAFRPQVGETTFIPESVFYLLAMKASNERARKFQVWVAKDVLPSIRKTGGYKMPTTPEEMIDLLLQNSSNANKRIDKVEEQSKKNEERITNLEDNRFLNPNEYGYLNTQVSARVKQVKEARKWELNREQNNQLYRAIGREIKQITGVRCRSQIRFKDFDKVCEFVKTWEPSHATLYNIGMAKNE